MARPSHPPQPRPPAHPPLSDGITDMSRAVPLRQYLQQHQPSTADRYRALSGEVARGGPAVDSARRLSDDLARQTLALQHKLVQTAATVTRLESEKIAIDAEVARLSGEDARLSASFAQDRVVVSRLLAVLERLQHDVPPVMALRPDDALSSSRSAMLIGASLPRVYHQAAALSQRLAELRRTREALVRRRAEAAGNAAALAEARAGLDRLLATKRQEADTAAERYGVLKTRLDSIAAQAVSLQALLQRVAQLRAASGSQAIFAVNAGGRLRTDRWLQAPVVGPFRRGGVDGVGGAAAPGITYTPLGGATVLAPADGKIIFAGAFPKVGRVLILEIGAGYDAVLVGLDQLSVQAGEAVLAGEPVGIMPKFDHEPRLYFELRQNNGRGMSPAPYIAVALRKAQ